MKKFLKWTAIIFIGLIVIGAVMGEDETATTPAVEETTAEETTEETVAAETEEAPAEAPAEEVEEDAGKMTKDKFDQIQNGMTYEEVVAIVGGEGNLLSEVGAEGEEFYTVMYEWEGASFASNANVTFQGSPAVVEMKAQFGLE